MSYVIEVSRNAAAELKALRAFDRNRISEAIDTQLIEQPDVETRNRKHLKGVAPSFEHVPPLWELRVGEYRVFYDLDSEAGVVYIRAVRQKKPDQTTEEVIS